MRACAPTRQDLLLPIGIRSAPLIPYSANFPIASNDFVLGRVTYQIIKEQNMNARVCLFGCLAASLLSGNAAVAGTTTWTELPATSISLTQGEPGEGTESAGNGTDTLYATVGAGSIDSMGD
jgi:hypothetical protein